MQYPTLAQLAEMTPEQRAQRLRGTPLKYRQNIMNQLAEIMASLVNENLRSR
ncbi:hypothetical protein IXEL_30 [Microbacterium phage Ixel]|nr:hypothetical protein IXEL_30 [Microbacterium phage Ixel]